MSRLYISKQVLEMVRDWKNISQLPLSIITQLLICTDCENIQFANVFIYIYTLLKLLTKNKGRTVFEYVHYLITTSPLRAPEDAWGRATYGGCWQQPIPLSNCGTQVLCLNNKK